MSSGMLYSHALEVQVWQRNAHIRSHSRQQARQVQVTEITREHLHRCEMRPQFTTLLSTIMTRFRKRSIRSHTRHALSTKTWRRKIWSTPVKLLKTARSTCSRTQSSTSKSYLQFWPTHISPSQATSQLLIARP